MSSLIEIKVPDVGNVPEIDIVEVLVQPGDRVELEQTLAVMETDKATMDLPSSAAGVIKAIHIKAGDKVAEGSLIATVEVSEAAGPAAEVVSAPALSPRNRNLNPPSRHRRPQFRWQAMSKATNPTQRPACACLPANSASI